ncbi:MAG: molybdopterin-dependent oxidoreductase [Rhizobiales bacterium]|nr:molybdopterin-dependent oxidoreductase [Hyphomicrobiales bacterium]
MTTNPSLARHPAVDEWLSFDTDSSVVVRSGKVDIGQRISAAVALVAAEELDVDPERIRVAERETGRVPDEGYTSGSRSMMESAQAVRLAAATARRHLLALASRRLAAPVDELEVANGVVRVPGTNRTTSYWQLAEGRPLAIPVDHQAAVKSPAMHRVLGRPYEAPGLTGLVTGTSRFVHDMMLPGMLHARLVRPPHGRARLDELDRDIESRLQGAHLVRDGSFLAIAHPDEWTATQLAARIAAVARWSPERGYDAGDIAELLVTNPRTSLPVLDGAAVQGLVPPPIAPPADAVATLTARFQRPYQMHAPIGPSAALAHLDGDRLMLWTHSQGIYPLRESIAEALGRDLESIRLIHAPGAGCYGHNGADDAAFDAALVACALPGRPILLKWSRADECGWEPYGSAMVVDVSAGVGPDGRVATWSHDTYSDTHGARPRAGAGGIGPARLLASRFREPALEPPRARPSIGSHSGLHRNQDPIYEFPTRRIVKNLVHDLPLRTSSLRALGAFLNVLAIESVMDELAGRAGADPIAFRLRHLSDARACRVLEVAAGRLGSKRKESGIGRGFGFAQYKNASAYAAVGIELSIDEGARVHLHRAVIAADAGEIIDRQGLTSQLEGGLLQAASLTLYEEVRYDAFGITSRDWETYPILGFDNAPEIEAVLIESPGEPFLGVGEATIGPTGGAIANAIHDAVGLRLRRVPFTPEAIRAAALA